MTSKILLSDQLAGFQSFLSVLTHISPEGTATLGWNILVRKYPTEEKREIREVPLTLRWLRGEFAFNHESASEEAALVGCPNCNRLNRRKRTWSYNVGLDVEHVVSVGLEKDSFTRMRGLEEGKAYRPGFLRGGRAAAWRARCRLWGSRRRNSLAGKEGKAMQTYHLRLSNVIYLFY